jgi:hypothetical protein
MEKLNCWEFKKCGRQPGGANVASMGICSAAAEVRVNGENGGKNGGRVCWVVAGTLCGGSVQGSFAQKLSNCLACEFHKIVKDEEGAAGAKSSNLLIKLGNPK